MNLPGEELITQGIEDLEAGTESIPALLVSIGSPRLRSVGYDLPPPIQNPEHRLYEVLAKQNSGTAHSRYNSLLRRLVSFERAAECVR